MGSSSSADTTKIQDKYVLKKSISVGSNQYENESRNAEFHTSVDENCGKDEIVDTTLNI